MSTSKAAIKIDRPIKICGEDREVKQSWRPNGKGGYKLTSVLLKKGTQKPLGGTLLTHVDEEEDVITAAAQHAEEKRNNSSAAATPRQHLEIAATRTYASLQRTPWRQS